MSTPSPLFYSVKGKFYCIWVSPYKGFLVIHRKASEGHAPLPQQTYELTEFAVFDDPYWIENALHQLIARYETDSTVNAIEPDISPRLLAAAANAPEWALDMTDVEIAEAMRLRRIIELITQAENVVQVRALLKSHAPLKGPAPLRGALVAIAVVCSTHTEYSPNSMSKIMGYAEDALRRIPRYEPGS